MPSPHEKSACLQLPPCKHDLTTVDQVSKRLCCFDANAVLPMRDDKPDNRRDDDQFYAEMEALKAK